MKFYVADILLWLAFLSHWWMMFFARSSLGKSDRSHDPLYGRVTSFLGFFFGFLVVGGFFYLRLQKEQLLWQALVFFVIYAFGFFLRLSAIRTLGRLFTFEIGIREDHKIIREGPYKWLRHPSYTGYFFMNLGFSGLLANEWFLILSVVSISVFFFLRIPAEEKMLKARFGRAYEEYIEESWGFFPGVY